MTHDPRCPCESHRQPHIQHLSGVCHYCQCDLIAKVRTDERQRFADVVDRRTTELTTCGHDNCRILADGARLALNECLASI